MGPCDVYFLHVLFKKFFHMCVYLCLRIQSCLTSNGCLTSHVLIVSLRTTTQDALTLEGLLSDGHFSGLSSFSYLFPCEVSRSAI